MLSLTLRGITKQNFHLYVLKKTSFHVTTPSNETRKHEDELLVVKKGPIPVGTTRSWTVDYTIPEGFHNVIRCSIIDIQHLFKVEVCVSGCHMNSDDSREVLLGTVALTNETSDQSIAKTEIPNNETKYPYQATGPIQNMQPVLPSIPQQTFSGNNVAAVMPPPFPLYPMPVPCIPGATEEHGSVPVDVATAGFGWQTGSPSVVPAGTVNETSYAYNPDIVPPEKQ